MASMSGVGTMAAPVLTARQRGEIGIGKCRQCEDRYQHGWEQVHKVDIAGGQLGQNRAGSNLG